MCQKGAHTVHQEEKHEERTYSFLISKKGEPGEEQGQFTYLTYSQPNWRCHGSGSSMG